MKLKKSAETSWCMRSDILNWEKMQFGNSCSDNCLCTREKTLGLLPKNYHEEQTPKC